MQFSNQNEGLFSPGVAAERSLFPPTEQLLLGWRVVAAKKTKHCYVVVSGWKGGSTPFPNEAAESWHTQGEGAMPT